MKICDPFSELASCSSQVIQYIIRIWSLIWRRDYLLVILTICLVFFEQLCELVGRPATLCRRWPVLGADFLRWSAPDQLFGSDRIRCTASVWRMKMLSLNYPFVRALWPNSGTPRPANSDCPSLRRWLIGYEQILTIVCSGEQKREDVSCYPICSTYYMHFRKIILHIVHLCYFLQGLARMRLHGYLVYLIWQTCIFQIRCKRGRGSPIE